MKRIDVDRIKNNGVRQRLQQAGEYKSAIDAFVDMQTGDFKTTLQESAARVDGWLDLMLELAEAVDLYEANPVLKQTLGTLPPELEKLKLGLAREADPRRKDAIQKDIDAKQNQLDKLQVIELGIVQANSRIDAILAQLSKVYALTLLPPDLQE